MSSSRRRRTVLLTVAAALSAGLLGCAGSPAAPPDTATPLPLPTPTASPATSAPSPSGTIAYAALGDSLASGIRGQRSYPDFYADALEQATGRQVQLRNIGRSGWTSGQLLAALRSDERFRSAVAQADLVSFNIGGNDLILAAARAATGTCGGPDGMRCVRQTVRSHERNWNAIVDELVALRASPAVPLLTFDIYTPFVPPGTRADALLEHLDEMNTAIWASHGRRGVHVGAAERLLEGSTESLLADDGLHPNAAGHRALARILLDLPVTPAG